MPRGVVHGTGGGVYVVVLEDGSEIDAAMRGRIKQEARTGEKVVIGDRVRAEEVKGKWVIEEVEPREKQIVRRDYSGRGAKAIVANLDRLVIVIAARESELDVELLDRLLVIAESNSVEGVVVLNKLDLDDVRPAADELAALYRAVGYPVHLVSARSHEGLAELRALLCSGTSALVGPSGVGKSSLLNALEPELGLATGELSRRTQRGRHTTVSARLIRLPCGGAVADTPGFADVGVWGVGTDELPDYFPEFRGLADQCRFRGCRHMEDKDCAVRGAVEDGRIARSRYASYRLLREEAKEHTAKAWEK
jgi:ribosome biogenesis GTPase / thiamine phosphate phosphatase